MLSVFVVHDIHAGEPRRFWLDGELVVCGKSVAELNEYV